MSAEKGTTKRTNGGGDPHGMDLRREGGAEWAEAANPPRRRIAVWLLLVLLVLIVAAVYGIARRQQQAHSLAEDTEANAAPSVSLSVPEVEKSAQEIVLPGNMQAYTMAPIYARTTGYVKGWYYDIGSHVHRGDLLAVIETPELDQQLAQAKAELATAKTNAALAKVTAQRYQALISSNAVSQQNTDSAVDQLRSTDTQVVSAEANVHRLEVLQGFERVVAPFDGVITARNIDTGQLITTTGSTVTAGAGTVPGNREIFDLSRVDVLRVFVNVPQQYAPLARPGVAAALTLPQYPGRTFHGTLVRSSDAIDPVMRTLLTEVDVRNADGALQPGSYTEVHLHVTDPVPVRIVPESSLILLPGGEYVGTVDSGHHARLVRVTIGKELGTTAEVLSGLADGEAIISNPPDSLTDGETVRVMTEVNNSMGEAR